MANEGNNFKTSPQAMNDQVKYWQGAEQDWNRPGGPMQVLGNWAKQTADGTGKPGGEYVKLLATKSPAGQNATTEFIKCMQGINDSVRAFFKDQSYKIETYLQNANGKFDETEQKNLGLANGTGLEGGSGT